MSVISAVRTITLASYGRRSAAASGRGIEYDLLPWFKRNDLPIMTYSPIERGRVLRHSAVTAIASRHPGVTSTQVALAWVLRQDGVCAIPRAGKPAHVGYP